MKRIYFKKFLIKLILFSIVPQPQCLLGMDPPQDTLSKKIKSGEEQYAVLKASQDVEKEKHLSVLNLEKNQPLDTRVWTKSLNIYNKVGILIKNQDGKTFDEIHQGQLTNIIKIIKKRVW